MLPNAVMAADGPLSDAEVTAFIENGFVPLREAFPRQLADRCRQLLWEQTGLDPDNRAGWTQPVLRLGSQYTEPFREASNTPRLHGAFDQLVGPGRWIAHPHLAGTVVVRFPVEDEPGDDGWHVDTSFEKDGEWRANIHSDGRSLLMLFLFSDVGLDDAPTRIRVGSHLDIAALLEPAGDDGLTLDPLPQLPERPIAYATGSAGDAFLCHPFLVHAADRHRGKTPRFLAQPGLLFAERLALKRTDSAYSPVEAAIRIGSGLS